MTNVALVGAGKWIDWSLPDGAPFVIFLKYNKDPLGQSLEWKEKVICVGNVI